MDSTGAGLGPRAFLLAGMIALFLALCLPPPAALAREVATVDSAAWCRAHKGGSIEGQGQCLQAESACRAALTDLAPAGGCPDRQLDRCVAQQRAGGSWCAILCCLEPDHPACRSAAVGMPEILSPSER